MSPVVPSQTEALLISDSDTFCVAFKKILKCFYLMYLFSKYLIDEDTGGIATGADTLGDAICNTADCTPTE